jgi:hypothetical protein
MAMMYLAADIPHILRGGLVERAAGIAGILGGGLLVGTLLLAHRQNDRRSRQP